jgi:6-phosphogluconolactonase (cycloisomerase 2 family)
MSKARLVGRRRGELATLLAITVALLVAAPASATEFLYVANADVPGPIAAYAIGAGGDLGAVSGSPFAGASGADAAVVTQDGRYLYVADSPGTGGSIAGFAIGSTGSLTPLPGSPYAATEAPSMIALTPNGRFLYAAEGNQSVDAYSVAPDGALSFVKGSPVVLSGAPSPCGAAVTPEGQDLYVAGSAGELYAFSIASDGTLTTVSGSPYSIASGACGVTVTPDGAHVYVVEVGAVAAYSIGAGGALTAVSDSPFAAAGGKGGDSDQAAISPDGRYLYVADQTAPVGGVSVFTIAADGGLSEIAGSPFSAGNDAIAVALTPDGDHAYTANYGTDTVSEFSVGSSGALTALSESPFTAGGDPLAIGITPDGGPTAAFSERIAPPGSAMAFNGSGSADPDAAIVRYDWSFGDGTSATNAGAAPSHSYRRAGLYTVTLTVTDAAGCSMHEVFTGQSALCNGGTKAQVSQQVTVAAQPSARIAAPHGAVFVEGARVGTTFSCREGAFGPGIASCRDSGGRRSPHGRLDTRGGGRHTYRVTAISKDGQRASATIRYTVRPLRVLALRAAPHAFVAATTGPTVAGRADTGTAISYLDTFAARTAFRVLRCASRGCARRVLVGSFAHRDRSGRNRLHFTGRVGGRALAPGRYIVDAVAALAGQHSKPATVVIVVRPRPAVCVDPDHDGDCDAPGQA